MGLGLKVLNVSSTINPVTGGGEAERTYQMSLFLEKLDIDCHVLTLDTGLSSDRVGFLGPNKVTVLPCLFKRFLIPKFSFILINRLVKNSDIVHLMGHWTLLNALAYLFIRINKKKYVVCPAGALPLFGRSKLIKIIYNFIVGRSIIRNASMCIAVTDSEIKSFANYGVDRNKIKIIPNGISPTDFISNDNHGFRLKHGLGDSPFILFVGRLNFIKGPDILLNAFLSIAPLFPSYNLVFVGPDGGMLSELSLMVKNAGMQDRIFFLGYLGGNDKSQAYHASALLVIPSRQEAMSIVVLEAGASGAPVLMSDQCGFNILESVGAGWVVPASINGLQSGISRALSDPVLLKVTSRNLKDLVLNRFSWIEVVKKYTDLYTKILDH